MIVALASLVLVAASVSGKTYERCELARELRYELDVAEEEVPVWVCIAEHESQYNTSAVGMKNADGSSDHGIFQISDLYWCSPPGKGWACGLRCEELEDDDIQDDFECAKKIHKEHQFLAGNGFKAWAVYEPLCKGPRVLTYVEGCFNGTSEAPPKKKKTTTTTKKVYPWLVPRPSSPVPGDGTPKVITEKTTQEGRTASFRVSTLGSVVATSSPSSVGLTASTGTLRAGPFTSTVFRSTSPASAFTFTSVSPRTVYTFPSSNRFGSTLSSPLPVHRMAPSPHNRKRESTFIVNGRVWV